jgi:hypothetical protein
MDTLTLLQFAAKRNEAAADILHHRISEAGAIARLVGGSSDGYSRFRLHDAVNRVYQSQNGTVTLIVTVKDRHTPKHAVSISTRGEASDSRDWLVAIAPPYEGYKILSHDIPLSPPVHWVDGTGTHWEVLLVSLEGDVYFDRESMSGRTRYTLRVVRDAEGYWGIPVPPMDHIDPDWDVVCTDNDGNDSSGEVAAVWENIPITEERWFEPEWRIEIAPYDLSALAAEIDNHIMAANTPNTPLPSPEENAENAENVVEALPELFEDDEDESSYLGASTLAKLRDAKLFDDKEDDEDEY